MEDRTVFKYIAKSEILTRCRYKLAVLIAVIIAVTAFTCVAFAQDTKQKKFKSPEDAFSALIEATRTNDTAELLAIFGPEGKDIISSGDAVADSVARARFVKAADEAVKYSKLDNKTVLPIIGKNACSFPIPIVRSGRQWVFSTEEGRQEILNRRIGRNELNTIQVSLNYVNAQREYVGKDRDGTGVLQYAQRFKSHNDKKDGLYWEAGPGEEESPLGPMVARATEEGYTPRKPGEKRVP